VALFSLVVQTPLLRHLAQEKKEVPAVTQEA
jgi:hypothetical protein